MANIYAVADIHGEYHKLDCLLEVLSNKLDIEKKSKAIFLGDYINKGKDSLKVLDSLISFKEKYSDRAIFLRGNHEEVLIEAMNDQNFSTKLNERVFEYYCDEFVKDSKPFMKDEHEEFLRSTEFSFCENSVLFIHAGIDKDGKQCLWSYGICGDLPEGIELVIRGHDIREEVIYYVNNIAIDTGAYLVGGKLTCLVFDIIRKISLGYYSVYDDEIQYRYRTLETCTYDGPWNESSDIDMIGEMANLRQKINGQVSELRLARLYQDYRNYFGSVVSYRVCEFIVLI